MFPENMDENGQVWDITTYERRILPFVKLFSSKKTFYSKENTNFATDFKRKSIFNPKKERCSSG